MFRGNRKAKDSQELETFQIGGDFYKIGKWLKHKIEIKDKTEKEREKISVGSLSRGCGNPHTARLYQTDCWIPNLTFFSSINFEGATVGDCFSKTRASAPSAKLQCRDSVHEC